MSGRAPILSIVAASRNDDHGGNLRRRMQWFIDTLAEQCSAHHLAVELIVVEWNPPTDRPPLRTALRWPEGPRAGADSAGGLSWRILTVPGENHARYRHGQRLPLYQMIAKNAGIRRAAAPFVLATNIDILFSDELIHRLATVPLDPQAMYRVDRHDVAQDVPHGAAAEKLAWCRTHRLRVHERNGTRDLRNQQWHRVYWPWSPGVVLLETLQALRCVPVVTRRRDHVNACGDFTLLHRDAWAALRGYSEFDGYSMHIDALLCHAASAAGYREIVWPDPCRIYHIEHAIGSGWSPEGGAVLEARLEAAGVPSISLAQSIAWAVRMRRDRAPILFNDERWGLANETLPEERST